MLHERHHIRADEPDDFNIRDMSEFLKMLSSTSQLMGILLLIVAMISLVVGGVGIMNIMLVSVTERTKEIGLRMAVGARSHQILRQFLIEAVVLCLMGGAAGILLGRCTAMLVRYFLHWPSRRRTRQSSARSSSRRRSASGSASTRPGRPRGSIRSMRCGTSSRG